MSLCWRQIQHKVGLIVGSIYRVRVYLFSGLIKGGFILFNGSINVPSHVRAQHGTVSWLFPRKESSEHEKKYVLLK